VPDGLQAAIIDGWEPAALAAAKALALFVTAAAVFRFGGRRTIAEFSPFDWVTAVAVGAIVGRSATAHDTSWLTATAALLSLMLAHAVVTRLRFVPCIRRIVDPPIRAVIREGNVDEVSLRRCGLTPADLDVALRQRGYGDPADVRLALFEANGAISVFPMEPRPNDSIAPERLGTRRTAG
jgi:uncharacterized membrane protein YcaP (DUF421 family)